jgi:hypothetical protein
VNSFPLITPTRPPPLSGITPMSTLPDALDHSTSTASAPTSPNFQYPRIRATFPVAAEYSMNSVSAPRCSKAATGPLPRMLPPLALVAVIAPQMTADPSGVMIESSWQVGAVAIGATEDGVTLGLADPALADGLSVTVDEAGVTLGLADPALADGLSVTTVGARLPGLPLSYRDGDTVDSDAAPVWAWFTRLTASRLPASRLPPPVATSRSHTPTLDPELPPSQSKASVCSSSVQDSDLASSGPKPMVPFAVQVRVAPVASVITSTSVRSGSRLLLSGWTAMARLAPSGERANPVISCPPGTDTDTLRTCVIWPSPLRTSEKNVRGSKAWTALLPGLAHGCSSSTKVRSCASAVTATTVPPAAGV